MSFFYPDNLQVSSGDLTEDDVNLIDQVSWQNARDYSPDLGYPTFKFWLKFSLHHTEYEPFTILSQQMIS